MNSIKDKTISFIIPVYNSEKYISDCLDSLVLQADEKDEIIIINDGSIDNSHLICQKYACQYTNIKYIKISNSGVSTARNIGIELCTCDWICFIDADDIIVNNAIENGRRQIESEIDGIYFNHRKSSEEIDFSNKITDVNSTLLIESTLDYFSNNDIFEKYMKRHSMIFSACWAKLFKRSILIQNEIKFLSDLKMSEDTCFCLEYLRCCSVIRLCDFAFYYYRINLDSATNQYNIDLIKNRNILFDYIFAMEFDKKDIQFALNKYVANQVFQMNTYVSSINDKYAILFFRKIISRKDVKASLKKSKGYILSDGKWQRIYYMIILKLLIYENVRLSILIGKIYKKTCKNSRRRIND